ncbi:SDR family NAD(P)-dependent oxidoreductase [Aquimarina algicola]|uniref:SDR family oxidoreductase n=1 Tax=Aquimarina algicola TaxID=2589995 RepID=A0A504JGN9_9FLAO|nr:SDR family oxidoreductase [Aquimarina algicola]TPN86938.1 SDR family oxidoreductase [Aquimarina algicola]
MKVIKVERKNALITGSSGGIGSAVARNLAKKGYHLILVDINREDNEVLASELPSARVITLDLTNRIALQEFCRKIPQFNLDIAFINAGVIHPGDVTNISEKIIDLQLDINLRSAILINKACGNYMKSKKKGNIINTVSTGGVFGLKSSATYSATKFGLRGFLMAYHSELKPYGVHVSGIYSGAVDTPMLLHETLNGGSAMNFIDKPSTVDDLVKAFNKALNTGKLEIYVPSINSFFPKILGGLLPGFIPKLYPTLERIGKKGQRKYLNSLEEQII